MKRTLRQQNLHQTTPRLTPTLFKVTLMKEPMGSLVRLRIDQVSRYEAATVVLEATNPKHVGKEMRLYFDKEPLRDMPTSWLPHVVPGTVLTIHTEPGKFAPVVRCIEIVPAAPDSSS